MRWLTGRLSDKKKKFNGETFYRDRGFNYKRLAQQHAKVLRSKGKKARVVPEPEEYGWAVYVR